MVLKYNKLFKPAKIRNLRIKNRIAMAPMGVFGLVTQDGCFNQRAINYYVERAKGGVGLIITGLTKIENEIEKYKPGQVPTVSINPSHFISTAVEMTEKVHAFGTKIFLQLGVGFGRVAPPSKLITKPIAPSVIPNYWQPNQMCRELTTEEVDILVKKTGDASEIAYKAGFDGVEIHAVHEGYLLDQFAISLFNKRNDKYGGNLYGRLTFPIEIVAEIKNRLGREFPVQLRYSIKSFIKDWRKGALPGENFEEKGRDIEEGLKAVKLLEEAGYDSFNVDVGSYDAWYWSHPPVYQDYGVALPYIKKLKKIVKVPIIVAGKLGKPALAQQVLIEGKADIVALGRPLLADPYWPKKILGGKEEEIKPCLGCHDGCMGRGFNGNPLSCAVNPDCGREEEYKIFKTNKAKNVLIVGGGIAGMEAARVAALKGHDVILYEKNKELGGHLIEASVPDFKRDEVDLLRWYKNVLKQYDVKINLNKNVSPDMVKKINPDTLIIATGSTPASLNVPGISRRHVAQAVDILLGKKNAGNLIAVIGGGLVGCETALWLAKQGKKVTIVEMADDIMIMGKPVPYMNRMMLIDLLKFYKVNILTSVSFLKIEEDKLILINKSFAEISLFVDTVILAIGFSPNQELYQALSDKFSEIYQIGDANKPRNIMSAIWEGNEVARNI